MRVVTRVTLQKGLFCATSGIVLLISKLLLAQFDSIWESIEILLS